MAFYGPNRNTNYNKPCPGPEPVYGGIIHPDSVQHPMLFDGESGPHEIVSSIASHNSQSYMITTKLEVVKYRRGDDDRKHNPTRKEAYEDRGAGDPHHAYRGVSESTEPRWGYSRPPPRAGLLPQVVPPPRAGPPPQVVPPPRAAPPPRAEPLPRVVPPPRAVPPRAGPNGEEKQNAGVIDSKAAARKYNGVLVSIR